MAKTVKRTHWWAAAVALAVAGCVVDNAAPGLDGGDTDADAGADTDTDTDADAGEDAGTYLACDENGDICQFDGEGEPIGVVEECPEQHSVCVETDGGPPECQCVEHFDLAAECAECETGYGGEECAVCELGYGGDVCDECVDPYVATDGTCAFDALCGSDSLWLDDGALPGTTRPDADFESGGTEDEVTTADLVTGLEWQRCPTGMVADGETCSGEDTELVSHSSAVAHCMVPFGGHDDWRLPEASELQSLFDFANSEHLNTTYFWGLPGEVWTSTEVPGASAQYFAVNFYYVDTVEQVDDLAFGVCVRDVSIPSSYTPRFVLGAADGSTAIDLWTDREWRRCVYGQTWDGVACEGDPKPYDPYGDEPAYDDEACDDPYGGHTDWRVPSAVEMWSLIEWCDEERLYPVEVFSTPLAPDLDADKYWTSTSAPEFLQFYMFTFHDRAPMRTPLTDPLPVLCVRDPD